MNVRTVNVGGTAKSMKTGKNLVYSGVLLLILIGACTHVGIGARPVAAQSSQKSFTPSKKLRLIAAARKGETKGSSILEWSIKNISPKAVNFRDTHVLRDYSFVVKDQEGHVVSPTEEGQRKIGESLFVSHRTVVTIRPGEEVKRQLVLTEIYDLKPGVTYIIYIARQISLDRGKTLEQIRSNPVRTKT